MRERAVRTTMTMNGVAIRGGAVTDTPLEPPDEQGPEGPVHEDDPPKDPDEPEGGSVDNPPQ
jgi:hypothetical protein